MDFETWIRDVYRRSDESITHAIHRLAFQLELGWTTVRRASMGSRVQPASANVLAGATAGAVSADSLKNAPTTVELMSRRRKRKRAPGRARSGNAASAGGR
jgi:hypothetical protein